MKYVFRVCTFRTILGIAMLVVLLLAGGAGAATFTVNASGGADYTRIQDAIDNASTGDTILVYSGTYYENVNVNKQLVLRGMDTGSGKPVVDANGAGSAIILSAGNSVLEGFAARNSSSNWEDAGIKVNSNNNYIKNNTASNNYHGISLDSSSNNNTLSSNTANSNNHDGILLYSSSNNTLIGNNASNNYYGIYCGLPATITL